MIPTLAHARVSCRPGTDQGSRQQRAARASMPRYTIMITLPRACPASTWRIAAAASRSGYDRSITGVTFPAAINAASARRSWVRTCARAADRQEIFAATTREQTMITADAVAARWESSHPVVARLLDAGIDDCLACLTFPLARRAQIRTTNGLERLHEEIKRRTRVVRIMPNAAA